MALLTYLLTPSEIYGNLWHATLTRNQTIFLSAATSVLFLEFMFARHLFCRFGCAVGYFQSLAWMGNRNNRGQTLRSPHKTPLPINELRSAVRL